VFKTRRSFAPDAARRLGQEHGDLAADDVLDAVVDAAR
jgi:hypothetical protein